MKLMNIDFFLWNVANGSKEDFWTHHAFGKIYIKNLNIKMLSKIC